MTHKFNDTLKINDDRIKRKCHYIVLEAMADILQSAETGLPYPMTSHFDREAPMDPTKPHGVL